MTASLGRTSVGLVGLDGDVLTSRVTTGTRTKDR